MVDSGDGSNRTKRKEPGRVAPAPALGRFSLSTIHYLLELPLASTTASAGAASTAGARIVSRNAMIDCRSVAGSDSKRFVTFLACTPCRRIALSSVGEAPS